MKRKQALLIFFSLFITINSYAQNTTGIVLNAESKKPIPYAQVLIVELNESRRADDQGKFSFKNVNLKNVHLVVSSLGYESLDTIISLENNQTYTFYLSVGHYNLDEFVYSIPSSKIQNENIVSIDKKKMSELELNSPLNLSEALSNIAGVDQTSTGDGIGKPVIRGLSGNRIVTYAQGIRIENQQWGDEHGLGVGSVGLGSVEVIKGPASLIYGSDAIGGVLYFNDEKYASQNSISGFVKSQFLYNTLGSANQAGIKVNKNNIKFNLFGAYITHADYQLPNFKRVYNTRFDEKNIKTSIGYNYKKWIANLRYSFLQNHYGIVEDTVYTENTANRKLELPLQIIDNHNLSLENKIYMGDSKLSLILGYTNNYRREFEEEKDYHEMGLKLNTLCYNLKWYSPTYGDKIDLIIGSQGMLQSNKNNGEELLIPNAKTNDLGVFGLLNIKLDKIQLQSGIRADNRWLHTESMMSDDIVFTELNNSYFGLSFSGGGVYSTKNIKVRANISNGFRAPSTNELLSNGIHHGTNRYIRGNVNLKNENATQLDASFDYQDEHFSFSVNPYVNSISNYIYLTPLDTVIDDKPVFDYIQSQALLYGGETGFHFHPHQVHWLHIESNLTTVWGQDEFNNPLPLIPQTRINSTFSVEFNQVNKVKLKNLFFQYVYKFKQNQVAIYETTSKSYNLLNMGAILDFYLNKATFEFSLGIKNILNTTYIDHLSRFKNLGIQNPGINPYIGIKFII